MINNLNLGRLQRIKLGRNNYVYSFKEKSEKKIIKFFKYKKRFIKEINFLKYLNIINIKSIPKIEYINKYKKFYICNYIQGKKVKKISREKIGKCADFINEINKKKKLNIQYATEHCESINDHFKSVKKKIYFFKNFSFKDKKFFKIYNEMEVKFNELKELVKKKKIKLNNKVSKKNLILSPSDFGFHNIKQYREKLFFFDFEYSGLDDSKKLICDFFCQPDYVIKIEYFSFFAKKIIGKDEFKKNKELLFILLQLYVIKWLCIQIKHLYFNPNDLKANPREHKLKILKYYKRTKLWKSKIY